MSVATRIEGVCFIREWPDDRGMVTYWCPGCRAGHSIQYGTDRDWTWDGNAEKPTFQPSVLVYPHGRSWNDDDPMPHGVAGNPPPRAQVRCHSFVNAGRIQYLADSEHELAGQTVDMVPLPESYAQFLAD